MTDFQIKGRLIDSQKEVRLCDYKGAPEHLEFKLKQGLVVISLEDLLRQIEEGKKKQPA